jgi:hypothetical protein
LYGLKPYFQINKIVAKSDFAMKNWEKSRKDFRQSDDREFQHPDSHKKKKLKPVEKVKYRMRGNETEQEE